MSGVTLSLQDAIEARLRASTDLATAMGGRVRVYSSGAPVDAPFPFIEIGDDVLTDASTQCGEASDFLSDLTIWARDDDSVIESRRQVKAMSDIVRSWIPDLTVAGQSVIEAAFVSARHRLGDDARTAASVLTFRFNLEPA